MDWRYLAISESLKKNDIAHTDRLARALLGLDGGPGSGNFGHKGRPGKVGGSGKGGGVQYRGGRSDIGYYGSRRDWLNGLSGEMQHEAVRFVAQRKMDLQKAQEEREKSLKAFAGMPEDYVEEQLRKKNLGKEIESMTPEEYAMKYGTNKDRNFLVGYAKEARNWDKNKDKLINENLTEEEKKSLEYLDYNSDDLNEDEKKLFFDLQAKAMDLPSSGTPIPEEILFNSGAKKREIKNPWANPEASNLYDAANALTKAYGFRVDPDALYNGKSVSGETLDDIERTSFERALLNYNADRGLKVYLRYKMQAYGGWERFAHEAAERLTTDEFGSIVSMNNRAKAVGDDIFDALDYVDQEERIRMFSILNKGMGGVDVTKRVNEKIELINKQKEAERKAAEEIRKQLEAERRAAAEKAAKAAEEAKKKRIEDLKQGITTATRSMEYDKVEKVDVSKNEKQLTHDEIVEKVGGPDKTEGSCVSAALSYVANKFGFNVRDFRGGKSCRLMAKGTTMIDIAETPGVDGVVDQDYNDYKTAKRLLEQMETGKEYVFTVASHCSIARKNENGDYEYLELQSSKNGYKPLNEFVLKCRFGCKRSHTVAYTKVMVKGSLIDVEKLQNCKSVENVLPYINTSEDRQKKGAGGGAK